MSFPILLNSEQYVSNNTYEIDLANTTDLSNFQVSVANLYVYYSWFNINDTSLKNNIFQLRIPNASGSTLYTLTIPNGAYNITDLNNFLQFWFIENNIYLVNSITGLNTYYAALVVNPTTYKIDLITSVVPQSLPAGFTNPGLSFASLANQHIQMTIMSTNSFGALLGFSNGSYPSSSTNVGVKTSSSNLIPNLSPISMIKLYLSCVYNPLSANSTLLHTFSSQGASIGTLIDASPNEAQWTPCIGFHKTLRVQLFDQLGRVLDLLDKNILIKLMFKKII